MSAPCARLTLIFFGHNWTDNQPRPQAIIGIIVLLLHARNAGLGHDSYLLLWGARANNKGRVNWGNRGHVHKRIIHSSGMADRCRHRVVKI